LLVLLLASFLWVSGCKSKEPNKELLQEIDKLREENVKLKSELDLLKVQLSKPGTETTPPPKPVVTQSPAPVAFGDIKGVVGEKEIIQLAQLGVFDTASGQFNPQKPITRAEFVRWLVRANNAIYAASSDKVIRMPEAGKGKATFSDVPPTHPDFRYIQGMADAGFAIGFDNKTFKPNQTLTREEMLGIKVPLDHRSAISSYSGGPPGGWTDSNKISKKYWSAINVENVLHNNSNIMRTFGSLKTFNPQAPVTRAEAALCIAAIGDDVMGFTTAQEALQKLAQQSSP